MRGYSISIGEIVDIQVLLDLSNFLKVDVINKSNHKFV